MEKYLPELISGCFSSSALCAGRAGAGGGGGGGEEGRLFAKENEWRKKEKRKSEGWIELVLKRQREEDRWSEGSHT